jgi:hypothetical protein
VHWANLLTLQKKSREQQALKNFLADAALMQMIRCHLQSAIRHTISANFFEKLTPLQANTKKTYRPHQTPPK